MLGRNVPDGRGCPKYPGWRNRQVSRVARVSGRVSGAIVRTWAAVLSNEESSHWEVLSRDVMLPG